MSEDQTGIWNRQYTEFFHRQRLWPAEELIGFIHGHYEHQPPNRESILEIGCGLGGNLLFLGTSGFTVFGIDLTMAAVKVATERLSKVLPSERFIVGVENVLNATELGGVGAVYQKTGRYHGIVDIRTGQHLMWRQHAPLYNHYHNLLLPGGWFFTLHLVQGTYDFSLYQDHELPDRYTVGLNDHSEAIFRHCGTLCMPEAEVLESQITSSGFSILSHESIRRSYQDRSKWAMYSAIGAQRRD